MKTEFEIVFTNISKNEILEKIKKLWWKCIMPNFLMKRVVFNNPLDKTRSYLRIRDEWDKITCTFKDIAKWKLDINSIKELETNVKDFDISVNIFRKLLWKEKSYEENYRETWEINGEVEIMIDIWPWLNPYIEIEARNEELVKKYSKLLWFEYKKGIFWTSFTIYGKELGIDLETMLSLKKITFDNIPKK